MNNMSHDVSARAMCTSVKMKNFHAKHVEADKCTVCWSTVLILIKPSACNGSSTDAHVHVIHVHDCNPPVGRIEARFRLCISLALESPSGEKLKIISVSPFFLIILGLCKHTSFHTQTHTYSRHTLLLYNYFHDNDWTGWLKRVLWELFLA